MPFVTHRGQRIHYAMRGSGETVVLLHGLFGAAKRWEESGWVSALARDFRVVCIDSLGHGESDKPGDPAHYVRASRAGDVIAVLDAIGEDRAHVLGYSMGGWIATAVALHHPERLALLALGGWDPLGGVQGATNDGVGFDRVLAALRARLPDLAASIAPEAEPALRSCWGALFENDGAVDALVRLRCPVLMWSGDGDACHDRVKALAGDRGFPFLSTRGDHASAVVLGRDRVVARLVGLLRTAEPRPRSR